MSASMHLPLLEPAADDINARRHRRGLWLKDIDGAVRRRQLTDFDYRVALAMTNYPSSVRGKCWAGIDSLADQVGRCDRTVRNSLKRLIGIGFLSVQRRSHRTNVYTFMYEGRELFENIIPLNRNEKGRPDRNPLADHDRNLLADHDRNPLAAESYKRESYKESLDHHQPHGSNASDNVVRPSDHQLPDDGIQQRAAALAHEVATIAGIDPRYPPRSWHNAEIRVAKWLRDGWNRATILLAVRTTMATRSGVPNSVRYFEQPIARLAEEQLAALPISTGAVHRSGSDLHLDIEDAEPPLPPDSLGGRWQAAKRHLAQRHGDEMVKAWFTGVAIHGLENASLVLATPTKFIGNWLTQHWSDRIVASWLEVGGDPAVNAMRFDVVHKTEPQNKFGAGRDQV
jgi:hypothetical protein